MIVTAASKIAQLAGTAGMSLANHDRSYDVFLNALEAPLRRNWLPEGRDFRALQEGRDRALLGTRRPGFCARVPRWLRLSRFYSRPVQEQAAVRLRASA